MLLLMFLRKLNYKLQLSLEFHGYLSFWKNNFTKYLIRFLSPLYFLRKYFIC